MSKKHHYADLKSPLCVLTLVGVIILWMFTHVLARELESWEELAVYPIVKIGGDTPQAANKPSNAIDGDLTTRWSAAWKENTTPPALLIDLGQSRLVNAVEIAWHDSASREYYFGIQVFVPVVGMVYYGGGWSEHGEFETYILRYSVDTRFIRIEGFGNDHPREKTAAWTSIAEIRVGYIGEQDMGPDYCVP